MKDNVGWFGNFGFIYRPVALVVVDVVVDGVVDGVVVGQRSTVNHTHCDNFT